MVGVWDRGGGIQTLVRVGGQGLGSELELGLGLGIWIIGVIQVHWSTDLVV